MRLHPLKDLGSNASQRSHALLQPRERLLAPAAPSLQGLGYETKDLGSGGARSAAMRCFSAARCSLPLAHPA